MYMMDSRNSRTSCFPEKKILHIFLKMQNKRIRNEEDFLLYKCTFRPTSHPQCHYGHTKMTAPGLALTGKVQTEIKLSAVCLKATLGFVSQVLTLSQTDLE